MTRRNLFLALLSVFLIGAAPVSVLSADDQKDVVRAEAAISRLQRMTGRFQQIDSNGNASTGVFWLQRPGRMRLEYDKPTPYLVVVGHGLVVFHDAQLGQTSNVFLSTTPLGLLLDEDVKLSGKVVIARFARLPGQIVVTVTKADSPGDGSLSLVFNNVSNELNLEGWIVTDAQNKTTRVHLTEIHPSPADFDPSLFVYIDPRAMDSGGGR